MESSPGSAAPSRGSARGFFVTGTDTGIGKTVAACSLVLALRRAGISAGAMKPVETGVGTAGPLDAMALREAADSADPMADVCPLQFSLPAAPNVAARHEGRTIELDLVYQAFERLAARYRAVIVEGAGGLLVPITDEQDMAALALKLDLPLIIVARPTLGTINHTRLTLEVARTRNLEIAGVVISHAEPISQAEASGDPNDADEKNLAFLRAELDDLLLAEIPFQQEGDTFAFPTAPLLPWLRSAPPS